MTQSFLKMFRQGNSESAPPVQAGRGERISRRSSGFQEFSKAIAGQEGLTILDLGPTSPRNIEYITSQGHKVYNEDVLSASIDPALLLPGDGLPAVDVERFFAENLIFRGHLFDAVLCWDIPDYLHESLVKPMVERICSVLKPGGVLLGFFHTRDAGPDAPYFRYHIVGPDTLELQPVPRFRLQRVFNNRHIENLFSDYKSKKFFLARDYIREVLVVR
jgi:SAM-dependent methyltransferase